VRQRGVASLGKTPTGRPDVDETTRSMVAVASAIIGSIE
jgi:hypothetical protein